MQKHFFSIVIKMFHMKHFGDDAIQNKTLTHMSSAALSVAVDTTQPLGDRTPTRRRDQVSRSAHLKRQPLFGRGVQGERRFSQRSGLSPCIPLHNPSHLRYNSRKRVKGWAHDQVDRTAAGCD